MQQTDRHQTKQEAKLSLNKDKSRTMSNDIREI